jgi:hypothetical protein
MDYVGDSHLLAQFQRDALLKCQARFRALKMWIAYWARRPKIFEAVPWTALPKTNKASKTIALRNECRVTGVPELCLPPNYVHAVGQFPDLKSAIIATIKAAVEIKFASIGWIDRKRFSISKSITWRVSASIPPFHGPLTNTSHGNLETISGVQGPDAH